MGRTALLLLLLLLQAPLRAESAVWVIEDGARRLFLGGTVHVLRPADFPLPPEFERAYAAADALYLETDLARLERPETRQRLLASLLYRDGRSLDRLLSANAYRALERFCAERGLPVATLHPMKPGLVLLTLLALELQRLGITGQGVDAYYRDRAVADGKPIGALESVDEQIAHLAGLGEGRESAFIRYALRDLERTGTLLDEMLDAWRHGDVDAMTALFVTEVKSRYPALYRRLLVERNRAWLPEIERLLGTGTTELVLVGAAHLVGDDGLLEELRRRGYRVVRP